MHPKTEQMLRLAALHLTWREYHEFVKLVWASLAKETKL